MEEQYVKVDSNGRLRLIPLSSVIEIIPMLELREADGETDGFRGFANLRGQTISVFDSDGSRRRTSPNQFILVIRNPAGAFGLIVDEVHHVLALPTEAITAKPVGNNRSRSVALVEGEILQIMDPAELIPSEVRMH